MIKEYASLNGEIIKRIEAGDDTARDELITNNINLVHSVVRRFVGRGFEIEDLVQIGCVGLVRAARRFDVGFGVQFSTYAVPMIIGEIKRFIRDDGIIKVSRSLKTIAANAIRIKESALKNTGIEPSVNEIAKKLGISPQELATALDSQMPPCSIYSALDNGSGEGRLLIESIESEEDMETESVNRLSLQEALKSFDERENTIIRLRYFENKTQTQVAESLGISQVQVSRLEKKILIKMREKIICE